MERDDVVQIPRKALELVKAILDDECEGRSLHLTPQCDGWKAKTMVDEVLVAAPVAQTKVEISADPELLRRATAAETEAALLRAALDQAPVAIPMAPFDKGPWTVHHDGQFGAEVWSDDSEYDAKLQIRGDMTPETKLHYACWLAGVLNAAPVAQPQPDVIEQDCSNCKHGGSSLAAMLCDRCTKWKEGPGLEGWEPKATGDNHG